MASTSSEYTRVKSSHCDESDSLSPGPRDEKEGDRLLAAEADAVRVKRRRAFCTCGIIVLTVAGAIGVGAYFLTKAVTDNSVTRSPLLFSDVFNTEFQPRSFSASWMPSSSRLVRLVRENSSLAYLETVPADGTFSGNTEPVKKKFCVFPESVASLEIASYSLSSDESYVLVAVNQTGVYRHSRISQYAIVSVNSTDPAGTVLVGMLNDSAALRYAAWGKSANSLVYVSNGNSQVVFVPDVEQLEVDFALSGVGVDGELFYGVPDWLYEEEIFATDHSVWLSPDDKHAAYTSINETGVKAFEWTVFGEPSDSYVTQRSIRYPKAGSPNPTVRLHLTSVAEGAQSVDLHAPSHLASEDHYLMQVHWMSSSLICALWMDRLQQNASFSVYNVTEGSGTPAYQRNMSTATWWENYPILSTVDGLGLLVKLPRLDGQQYVHLALMSVPANGNQLTLQYLTDGAWEVVGISYVADDHVAFTATIPGAHLRQVYRVSLAQTDVKDPPCITCYSANSTSCGYNSFLFSHDRSYLLQYCQGPGLPLTMLSKVPDNGGNPTLVYVLEDNALLDNMTKSVYIPTPEFLTIDVNNVSMPAMRWLPADTSVSSYPTLFYAYNGPLSQSVIATYPLSGTRNRWHTQLIGQYGFQIIVVDGRGTAFLGDKYGKSQYRELGIVETEDQLAAARYAVAHLKADAKKLGFWGWSYGGYMASMLATSGTGLYSACMAVAPVTDWRYYDTAYTERFMRLPTEADNLVNYDRTSVLHRTGMFNGTHYFLIHGTADDNVHFQNTAQLVRELVEHQVDFRLQFYTDKAHSLSGSQTQQHLYRQLSNFLRSSLQVT